MEVREVNAAVPANVQSQVHGASVRGEGEPEQSSGTSEMPGNAEFEVLLLQAQRCHSDTVNNSGRFKGQLQKKLCYSLNSGLLFLNSGNK